MKLESVQFTNPVAKPGESALFGERGYTTARFDLTFEPMVGVRIVPRDGSAKPFYGGLHNISGFVPLEEQPKPVAAVKAKPR